MHSPFSARRLPRVSRRQSRPQAGAVARIGEDVRRAVGEYEPRAGVIAQRQLLLALDEMGPHHAGDRIAVAQPETVEPDMRRLQHQLFGMRGPAQEREIRGDGEFDVAGHLTHTSRAGTSAAAARSRAHVAIKSRRGTARSAGRSCPRRGNNRARGPPSSLHQAPSMRSGPSAATTSCSARRQRKRSGGPSGTRAKTSSIGSGLARSRSGRGLKSACDAEAAERRPSRARLRAMACAGQSRDRRVRGYGCPARPGGRPAGGRAARSGGRRGDRARLDLRCPPRPICSSGQGSAMITESRARSKPKPGSISSPSAASRSTNSARIACGSRTGREVPAAMRLHHAVGAEKGKLDAARAVAAPLQHRLQPRREPLDGREHVLFARDRLGESAARRYRARPAGAE